MRRGTRTVVRFCACGCGERIEPYISQRTGRVTYYPEFISGHGNKDWGKRWSKRLKENGHPLSKPIGTRSTTHSGYIKVKCADGKWRYEHRIVANAPDDMHVHHVNRKTSDNTPDNLQVISNSEHGRLHHTITRWSKLYDACVECGSTERSHCGRGLCFRCWQRMRARELGFWP